MKKFFLTLMCFIFLISCYTRDAEVVREVVVGAGQEVEIAPGLKVTRPADSRLMCECMCQYGFAKQ